mgnify:CR=1 FL=1
MLQKTLNSHEIDGRGYSSGILCCVSHGSRYRAPDRLTYVMLCGQGVYVKPLGYPLRRGLISKLSIQKSNIASTCL